MPTDNGISFKYKNVGEGKYRPIIPIEIEFTDTIRYEVLVDSGADFSIFDAEVAEAIGIEDLTTGERFSFGGVTGEEEIGYRHKVTLRIRDCSYQVKVGFSEHIRQDGTGIVGQKGFFDMFSVKFDYSKKSVVLRKKDWT